MSPMWSAKSASVEAAMKNMLAAATQQLLDQWDPFDDEDCERRDRSQQELDDLDRGGDPLLEDDDGPPPRTKIPKHKADKKAAKILHERVIYYRTESDRKRRTAGRRNNNGYAHTGAVDGYMQGHPTRQIDAPPRSPTDDYDSQNPHLLPPQPPRKRGFSLGALFRSSKKKPVSPPSPVIPHHDNEDSIDSYEDRHPRQAPLPPPHDIHNPPYQQEPASPTKLVRRHGSTSSRTRGYDNHPSPPMQTRVSSRDGGDPDRVHRTSSNRHRERDRDRDRDRERNRDRDRGADPRGSGRHDRSYSYDERRYPPSSRRDIGNPDKYGSTRHREGSRERERSSKHRDDEYRQGSSSHRHRSSRGKHDGDDDEDSEERRRRRRERREREKDKDRERKKHDDPRTKPQSPHDQEGSHGGDGGGDFHDAPSLHESEHRPRDDPDALSVSDHINGGLHVTG